MPIDEKDNLDLYEEREHELLDQLGRMEITDPNRDKIEKELDTLAKIRSKYLELEQNRLNNNAKNDIEEAKLLVEKSKLENEKRRNRTTLWATFITTLFTTGIGYSAIMKSYHMDEEFWPHKDLKVFGQNLIRTKMK